MAKMLFSVAYLAIFFWWMIGNAVGGWMFAIATLALVGSVLAILVTGRWNFRNR